MSDNRREFYRLGLYGEEAFVKIPGYSEVPAQMRDISGSGCSFASEHELTFRTGKISFVLENHRYEYDITFIRREAIQHKQYMYAVAFVDMDGKAYKRMYESILRIDAKRRLDRAWE